jgi:hypothetical protein
MDRSTTTAWVGEFKREEERKMGHFSYDFGVALRRGGFLNWVIVACWFLVPVLGQTIMHPTDAAGFWYWLNSQQSLRFYSSHEVVRGEFTAVLALGAVIFVYLVVVTLFYRKTQVPVALWPVAALLVGVIGNAGWWFGTGYWDNTGALAGFFPAALAGLSSLVCERLGANFVFGSSNRPAFTDPGDY